MPTGRGGPRAWRSEGRRRSSGSRAGPGIERAAHLLVAREHGQHRAVDGRGERVVQRATAANLASEKGVLALETGVFGLETGVSASETGVFALDMGVIALEMGVVA